MGRSTFEGLLTSPGPLSRLDTGDDGNTDNDDEILGRVTCTSTKHRDDGRDKPAMSSSGSDVLLNVDVSIGH